MQKIFLLIILSVLNISAALSQAPPYHATIYDSTKTAGYYFLVPSKTQGMGGIHAQLILDHFGDLVYYRPLGPVTATPGFKVQPNGMITYLQNAKFYVLDSTFTVKDSVVTKNGIYLDSHEFQILPNGNLVVFASNGTPTWASFC